MDVSKFQLTGEWLEIEVESTKGKRVIKFMIKPLSSSETIDFGKIGTANIKKFFEEIEKLVVDWDLTKGTEKLECTEETKKQYLPYLVSMNVKRDKDALQEELEQEDGEKSAIPEKVVVPEIVGGKILEFARDFSNFIKN